MASSARSICAKTKSDEDGRRKSAYALKRRSLISKQFGSCNARKNYRDDVKNEKKCYSSMMSLSQKTGMSKKQYPVRIPTRTPKAQPALLKADSGASQTPSTTRTKKSLRPRTFQRNRPIFRLIVSARNSSKTSWALVVLQVRLLVQFREVWVVWRLVARYQLSRHPLHRRCKLGCRRLEIETPFNRLGLMSCMRSRSVLELACQLARATTLLARTRGCKLKTELHDLASEGLTAGSKRHHNLHTRRWKMKYQVRC